MSPTCVQCPDLCPGSQTVGVEALIVQTQFGCLALWSRFSMQWSWFRLLFFCMIQEWIPVLDMLVQVQGSPCQYQRFPLFPQVVIHKVSLNFPLAWNHVKRTHCGLTNGHTRPHFSLLLLFVLLFVFGTLCFIFRMLMNLSLGWCDQYLGCWWACIWYLGSCAEYLGNWWTQSLPKNTENQYTIDALA